jgi:hypothetical protein
MIVMRLFDDSCLADLNLQKPPIGKALYHYPCTNMPLIPLRTFGIVNPKGRQLFMH